MLRTDHKRVCETDSIDERDEQGGANVRRVLQHSVVPRDLKDFEFNP